ncbi:helix-turn-helix domain-containing protein [Methylorubrum extorquens]|uniref:helix-turn-helix domain-containing protein n=1 Tax=Methylorubrum extorquens TaxID=408 RepID=UPI00209F6569|nr:helix-turn-helix domain-containing protein [Methylorubrum extorquens]MCP1540020.1 transcriptional regulator with XRE-family HTH domain [Methylorubrum extorquens]
MSRFLQKQIDTLSDLGISQRDIALQAGYDKPNILSMFKRGETKVPLNKVLPLSKALRVDPQFFFRLAVQQPDMPVSLDDIDKTFGNTVSGDEMEIVKTLRESFGGGPVRFDERQMDALREIARPKTGVSAVPKSL